jgi:hypothetical protein
MHDIDPWWLSGGHVPALEAGPLLGVILLAMLGCLLVFMWSQMAAG